MLFWLSSCCVVGAQTVTDIELQAGYCLGVATAQLKREKESVHAADTAEIRALHKDMANLAAERLERFRDYLTAKGFLEGRNPEAVKVAIVRGVADVARCDSELKEDFFKSCGDRCIARFGLSSIPCVAKCPSPDACKRVKKCLENFLPF